MNPAPGSHRTKVQLGILKFTSLGEILSNQSSNNATAGSGDVSLIEIKSHTLNTRAICMLHTSFCTSPLEMHDTAFSMMPSQNGHTSLPANKSNKLILCIGTCLHSIFAQLHKIWMKPQIVCVHACVHVCVHVFPRITKVQIVLKPTVECAP